MVVPASDVIALGNATFNVTFTDLEANTSYVIAAAVRHQGALSEAVSTATRTGHKPCEFSHFSLICCP